MENREKLAFMREELRRLSDLAKWAHEDFKKAESKVLAYKEIIHDLETLC